ncbi:HNH endonuclease [Pelotomaculum propionicicum]|uniref:HNH endonuclease n=1 Tax=Pelotomaculum propionicicum TaxID=258475 RepID=UPI003B7CCC92
MAIRNPSWKRDELILALDLYFRHNPSHISPAHDEVKKLSDILNTLPIHTERPITEKFRNPNGVYMKLCNFLRYDPDYHGVGLQRGGQLEKEIWNEFAYRQGYLHRVASVIVDSMKSSNNEIHEDIDDDEESEFPEGKILYRKHRIRERNRKLVSQAKAIALKNVELKCSICGFDYYVIYGDLGKGFIECHHTIPVSEYVGTEKTKVKDLALVCSNCHRMLHRRRPWLRVSEIKDLIKI